MRRTVLLLLALILPAGAALAAADPAFDIEGRYQLVTPPQPTSNPNKVEVVYLFWYGCPFCNRFQPYIEPWQADRPEYVEFVRMPAVFRKRWEIHARAYYVSREIGALDETHTQMFDAIHKERRRLDTRASLREFFVERGVDGEDFDKTYESAAVESGIENSRAMQVRYGIRGVPTVIVNGKYRISGSIAGSYANVIKVIDALVAKEYQELSSR